MGCDVSDVPGHAPRYLDVRQKTGQKVTMNTTLFRMFQHMAWADELILSNTKSLNVEIEKANVLFGHIVAAEYIWLCRINAMDIGTFTPWTELTVSKCELMLRENHAAYLKLIQNSSDEKMMSIVKYRTIRGDMMETRLEDILVHVGLHGSYHRGQIAAALKAGGIMPSPTDYIIYCRQL